jgi:hypothetical protein
MIILIMLLLGPIHVIWALIELAATSYQNIRKHFLFYSAGVILYLLVLSQLKWTIFSLDEPNPVTIYFFAGAWSLAIYHFWISFTAHRLFRQDREKAALTQSQAGA